MSAERSPELVGLVPAAGYATRLQPLAGSKEALVVHGRPLLLHVLERMRAVGCMRIRVTTRPAKQDVIAIATAAGAEIVLAEPPSVSASLAEALVGMGEDAIALIGFPDTVWAPTNAFAPLVDAACRRDRIGLGIFPAPRPHASDEVAWVGARVVSVRVKPSRPRTPWTWGIAAARVANLRGIAEHAEPGEYFDRMARAGAVEAVVFHGPYHDAGTPEGLSRLSARPVYDLNGEGTRWDRNIRQ